MRVILVSMFSFALSVHLQPFFVLYVRDHFHLITRYPVLDEADRMLSLDFEEEINKILAVIPRERRTLLFSATMTSKVAPS